MAITPGSAIKKRLSSVNDIICINSQFYIEHMPVPSQENAVNTKQIYL